MQSIALPTPTKKCSGSCGDVKLMNQFGKNGKRLRSQCKSCRKAKRGTGDACKTRERDNCNARTNRAKRLERDPLYTAESRRKMRKSAAARSASTLGRLNRLVTVRVSRARAAFEKRWPQRHVDRKDSPLTLIGCTMIEYKAHIENTTRFKESKMTWDKCSYEGPDGWQIEHITPPRYYDLSYPGQQRMAFSYKNTWPMWKNDHVVRSEVKKQQAAYARKFAEEENEKEYDRHKARATLYLDAADRYTESLAIPVTPDAPPLLIEDPSFIQRDWPWGWRKALWDAECIKNVKLNRYGIDKSFSAGWLDRTS
jgi:hypothetical protein